MGFRVLGYKNKQIKEIPFSFIWDKDSPTQISRQYPFWSMFATVNKKPYVKKILKGLQKPLT